MPTGSIKTVKRLWVAILAIVVLSLASDTSGADWYRYDESRLIEQDFNDGDSFHVQCGHRHYIFRLYFVDAPETGLSFPDRVDDQAKYWELTPKQTVKIGQDAAKFARTYLSKPFTVHTKRVDARGRSDRPRYFGMVETEKGFLSEALVRHGLARIYGMSTELPNAKPSSRHWGRLRLAEKAAKREKLGGWARHPAEPEPLPLIEPQDYVVRTRLPVFDPERHSRVLGILQRGAEIRILGAEGDRLLRIRFKAGDVEREGLCRRDSVSLPTPDKEQADR
ncbi:MAG: thermonuclease family protein [Kiritimatiellae bacterium]|nr:thermonuclease family protein [Kiritimatiellia bacterium]